MYLNEHFASQKGTTLLEVLIAVLVVTIGLLGVASMQINTMRNNQASYERSMSAMFTYSIAERIKANRDALDDYTINVNANAACQIPAGATLADTDRREWLTELQAYLGVASCGGIDCDAATNTCDISIRWGDLSRFSAGAVGGFATNTRVSL